MISFCNRQIVHNVAALNHNIYLIGDITTQIYGNKLPSKLQVLQVFFFNTRELKLTIDESAKLVIKEVTVFWETARLPTQLKYRCIEKLKRLYQEWRDLQKCVNRTYSKVNEDRFCAQFHNLFDIAHGNILEMIDSKQKEFLLNQRENGRIGYIGDIETVYDTEEKSKSLREEIYCRKLEKSELEKELMSKYLDASNEF